MTPRLELVAVQCVPHRSSSASSLYAHSSGLKFKLQAEAHGPRTSSSRLRRASLGEPCMIQRASNINVCTLRTIEHLWFNVQRSAFNVQLRNLDVFIAVVGTNRNSTSTFCPAWNMPGIQDQRCLIRYPIGLQWQPPMSPVLIFRLNRDAM